MEKLIFAYQSFIGGVVLSGVAVLGFVGEVVYQVKRVIIWPKQMLNQRRGN